MAKYFDVIKDKSTLSPSTLEKSIIKNKNRFNLEELLSRSLLKSDNGFDIGTASYLKQSEYYFLKAKALQNNSFIPIIEKESAVPMNKKAFKNYLLKEGDLIISKDSNIGECAILDQNMENFMPCGALYRLPINNNKLYIFAFIKSIYFKEQLDELVPKGATIRHAGKKFLKCSIPFPNNDRESKIILIEIIVRMIMDKEKIIKNKNFEINELIENELNSVIIDENNELFRRTSINELEISNRLDATFYTKKAKIQKTILKKYKNGANSLEELGFLSKRGQNLQVSNIGKSVYSPKPKLNYYTVIKPTNFTDYGTVDNFEYLGNKNDLQTLSDGDIVFSAEGTVGKCVLFTKTSERWITNIHGIVFKSTKHDAILSAYVACILRFYREWGFYDHFTVGGQGGSLGKNYWEDVLIPNFPRELVIKIANLYHKSFNYQHTEIKNIYEFDNKFNQESGIIEIADTLRNIKNILNNILDMINNDEDFETKEVYQLLSEIYNK